MWGQYTICEILWSCKPGFIWQVVVNTIHYCLQREFLLARMDRLGLMGKTICSILSNKSNLPPSSLILTTMLRQAGILSRFGGSVYSRVSVQAIHLGLRGTWVEVTWEMISGVGAISTGLWMGSTIMSFELGPSPSSSIISARGQWRTSA